VKIDQWEGKDGTPHAQLRVHAKYIDFLNIGKKQEKHNEELQETVNLNKGSMSFMTNYIGELEKLIIDDDVEKPKKKGKKKNRKRKRKGKK